jgi:hypothetical protein
MFQLLTKKQAPSRKQTAGGVKEAEFLGWTKERGKSNQTSTEREMDGRRCISLFFHWVKTGI